MKNIRMFVVAILLLVLGMSGRAMAYFDDGDLIRVVYGGTGSGTEYATDLGNFATLTSPGSTNVVLNTHNIDFTKFGGATVDQLYVAYFMVTSTAGGQAGNYVWTSGPLDGQTGGGRNKYSQFESGAHTVVAAYQVAGGSAANAVLLQSDPASYWNIMGWADEGGRGQMISFIPAGNADKNMADLSTTGYVDQYLYFYGTPNTTSPGTQIVLLRTFADGHTEMMPAGPNNCAATLNDDVSIHVPILVLLDYKFYLHFDFDPNTFDWTLNLDKSGQVSDMTPYSGCEPATLSFDGLFHMPAVKWHDAQPFWLDLVWTGEGLTVAYSDCCHVP